MFEIALKSRDTTYSLPLGPAGSGCLLAVSEDPGGFGTDDRACLELIARALHVAGL